MGLTAGANNSILANQIIWVVSRGRLLCGQSLFNFRWDHRDECDPKLIAAGTP